jgi:hypothetical protein
MTNGWNPLLFQRIDGIRKYLIAQYSGSDMMTAPDKGRERELFVSGFLERLFTNAYRFGEGRITDYKKDATGQIDVVVEVPLAPSFPLIEGGPRLYLADSIALTLEVKSDISKEINDVRKAVKQVKRLVRKNVLQNAFVSEDSPDPLIKWKPEIPYYVFSYSGPKKFETLIKLWENFEEQEKPDGILILNSGFYISNLFSSAQENDSMMFFITEITAHLNNYMNIGYPNLLTYSQGYEVKLGHDKRERGNAS